MRRLRGSEAMILVLAACLLVWWRGHTFGPTIAEWTGLTLWPVVEGASEPLDCDEAAYGYMGRRMAEGAVLYADLTEYKPPGGYWFYFLAVAAGGASEMTIRLMVLPVLVLNLWLIGFVAKRLSNGAGAVVAMIVFILMSTDPYVFGNGSNLEHLMNLALTGAAWAFLKSGDFEVGHDSISNDAGHRRIGWLLISGACVGLAATVKQVALIGMFPILAELLFEPRSTRRKIVRVFVPMAGFALPWLVVGGILAAQGALDDAWADVVEYSRALAADTPPDANAPPGAWRWLTGNADPRNGRLPWPFGRTDWLVWWGAGAWPMHAFTIVVFACSVLCGSLRAWPERRFVLWTYAAAWAMIALPGLYWPHYYMLLAPASALIAGTTFGNAVARARSSPSKRASVAGFAAAFVSILAVGLTGRIQIAEYLMVPAQQLTVKYKGGAQWVTLRELAGEMKKRTADWPQKPLLEVWGWQSPLLYYSGLNAPSRYFFTDPLAKAKIGEEHPLVTPRIRELAEALSAKRPELVFCGDIPFPQLKAMLDRDYVASSLVGASPDGRGLFVRKDKYQAFHAGR